MKDKLTDYIKLKDPIRWALFLALIYFIYQETGIATSGFAFLTFLYTELNDILERVKRDRDNAFMELFKSIKRET